MLDLLFGQDDGQGDGEGGPQTGDTFAGYGQRAAHHTHCVAGNGKAEADAFALFLAFVLELLETLEDEFSQMHLTQRDD